MALPGNTFFDAGHVVEKVCQLDELRFPSEPVEVSSHVVWQAPICLGWKGPYYVRWMEVPNEISGGSGVMEVRFIAVNATGNPDPMVLPGGNKGKLVTYLGSTFLSGAVPPVDYYAFMDSSSAVGA